VPIGTCRTLLRSAPISSTQRKPQSSERENKVTAIVRRSLNIGDTRWWRCATVAAQPAVSSCTPKAIGGLYARSHSSPPETQATVGAVSRHLLAGVRPLLAHRRVEASGRLCTKYVLIDAVRRVRSVPSRKPKVPPDSREGRELEHKVIGPRSDKKGFATR
jgi:hypothetical protein